jgi:hypothetical protein
LLKREATPSDSLHGATMEEFSPPEIQEGNDCTLESMFLESLKTSPVMLPTKRKSAMPDCPQITGEKRVKLESSIDSTQEQQSSKISEVDSTSEKKVYILFGPSLFRRSQRNYCLAHRQIVKIWFWALGVHLQKGCLQDHGSQQS